ncbi:DUF5347 family protein [Edaphovirga cremea]|uniref:DUF5347 family protein n=1 Tax=Edaphovirga cremea TaxID=2267246 RepID=UPI0039893641
MNRPIAELGIAPTQAQIKKGLEYSHKCMQMIANIRNGANKVQSLIDSLHARHRGFVYFTAGINKDRHHLKFEQLGERERLLVIEVMRDLKELTDSFPKRLCNSDSVIKSDE